MLLFPLLSWPFNAIPSTCSLMIDECQPCCCLQSASFLTLCENKTHMSLNDSQDFRWNVETGGTPIRTKNVGHYCYLLASNSSAKNSVGQTADTCLSCLAFRKNTFFVQKWGQSRWDVTANAVVVSLPSLPLDVTFALRRLRVGASSSIAKNELGSESWKTSAIWEQISGVHLFPSATVIHSDKCMHTFESTLRALESILTNRIAFWGQPKNGQLFDVRLILYIRIAILKEGEKYYVISA